MGLTLVDSGVWIDLLANRNTPQVDLLTDLLDAGKPLGIGDLMLVEVLQGARHDRQFDQARRFLTAFDPVVICDHDVAVQAAHHYRTLRAKGITIRKTIDTLIATRCIVDDIPLLYADRDFDPFVDHLGLRPAIAVDAKR